MNLVLRLPFLPSGALDWCYSKKDFERILAIGAELGIIQILEAKSPFISLCTIEIHRSTVTAIRYNKPFNTGISTDREKTSSIGVLGMVLFHQKKFLFALRQIQTYLIWP